MKRKLFAWMMAISFAFTNVNSFVFAEEGTEEPAATEETSQEETVETETPEQTGNTEETVQDNEPEQTDTAEDAGQEEETDSEPTLEPKEESTEESSETTQEQTEEMTEEPGSDESTEIEEENAFVNEQTEAEDEPIEEIEEVQEQNYSAGETDVSNFEYTNSDGKITITKYKGSDTEVVIPSVIDGNPVTSIGADAFKNCRGLTSITIPSSVTSIDSSAFSYCIGLTSVTIPDSVISIGERAFYDCSSLASITIPDSVTRIDTYAFSGCTGLKTAGPIGSGYDYEFGWKTSIPANAFYACHSLTNITIPEGVTSIGDFAFRWDSGLTSITIPDSVKSMGLSAFAGCRGLKTAGPIGGGYDCEFGWKTSIPDKAFNGCSGLNTITIPDSVTSIGKDAFDDCTGLTSITLPDGVTSIGIYAFAGCTGLTSIVIPDSVTNIGYSAFQGCTGLTSITLPESLTTINNQTFYECTSLTSIVIPDSVTSIDAYAFAYCSSLTRITIPSSVTSIGPKVFYNTAQLKDIFYYGSKDKWNTLIRNNNLSENVTIHYSTEVAKAIDLAQHSVFLNINQSMELKYFINPVYAFYDIVWLSNDESICTVDDKGVVTGHNSGQTNIRIQDRISGKYDELTVYVGTYAESITLGDKEATIFVGDSKRMIYSITPENVDNADIVWTSDNPNVVRVDETGLITCLKKGKAVITAETINGKKDSCTVNVYNHVSSVKLNKQSIELFEADTEKLTANILPADSLNKNVIWESSDQTVATVDNDGMVTAVNEGTAIITVTTEEGQKTAQCTVRVNKYIPVEEIKLSSAELELLIGKTDTLKCTIFPKNATDQRLKWTSGNHSVATVDSNGMVTAVNEGTAIITVTTEDGQKTAQCTVRVRPLIPVSDIKIDSSELELQNGQSIALEYTISPENVNHSDIVWSSDDESICTVDNKGIATGHKLGRTIIRVQDRISEKYDEITVYVGTYAEAITFGNKEAVLFVGDSERLIYSITPENVDNTDIVWTSDNPNVVSVDETGLITCLKKGKAVITAKTFNGKKDSCTVIVYDNITSLKINESIPLSINSSFLLDISSTPDDIDRTTLTWKSSNEEVVKVDNTGRITAVGIGTADITVTDYRKKVSSTCSVTVHEKISLLKTDKLIDLIAEENYLLNLEIAPNDIGREMLVWTSSNENVVKVDNKGMLTAVAPGSAVITVKDYGGTITSKCTVNVYEKVDTLKIDSALTLNVNDTYLLNLDVKPTSIGRNQLVWTSSNNSVAKVDSEGKVTAVGLGAAVISVSDYLGRISSSCIVNVSSKVESIQYSYADVMASPTLTVGDSIYIKPKVFPETASDTELIYTSSDPYFMTVDENGVITAVREGYVVITVSTPDGSVQASTNLRAVRKRRKYVDSNLNLLKAVLIDNGGPAGHYYKKNEKYGTQGSTECYIGYDSNSNSIIFKCFIDETNGLYKYKATTQFAYNLDTYSLIYTDKDRTTLIDEYFFSFDCNASYYDAAMFDPNRTGGFNISNNQSKPSMARTGASSVANLVYGITSYYFVDTFSRFGDLSEYGICSVDNGPSITDITLNKTEYEILPGETINVAAYFSPYDSSPNSITWTNNFPDYITLMGNKDSSRVTVKGIKPGIGTITVKADSRIELCTITVVKPLSFSKKEMYMGLGNTQKPLLTLKKYTREDLLWSSSAPGIASVDQNGFITAKKLGDAVITVTTKDGKYSETINVIVKEKVYPIQGFSLNYSSTELPTNKECKLIGNFTPTNTTNQKITWTSDNPKVATVDSNGNVKALSYGTAVITAVPADNPSLKKTCKIQTRFYDVVDSTQSYYRPVYWGADNGVVAGYDGGLYFGPDNVCTRAQFVTFLWRLAGRQTGNKNVSFKDISTSMNYYNAVKWAVSEGIIVGYKDDNTFRPDNEVTRGQVATMLWRFAGRKTPTLPSTSPFTDINSSNSSYRAVVWGQKAGVIKGYKDGTFQPDASCLRQHIVTFLYRYARDVMKKKV